MKNTSPEDTIHRGFRIPKALDDKLVSLVKYPQTLTDIVILALTEWIKIKKK